MQLALEADDAAQRHRQEHLDEFLSIRRA